MNIAAYCRVSTDKTDQLNSLEAQKRFFAEYADKNGHNLVRLYADEGISGTKIKNRLEFQRLMADSRHGFFDMVVVKDISRFARNTVDLLQSIRTLKSLGIETTFLTANMGVLGQSEFVLTIFGALAQEESANTSKRIKFGKKINAEKGRVPNIVFGYDKVSGDYFNLAINSGEASVIRQIYDWYLKDGDGALKIANRLNERHIKTKRGCDWSQNAVCRILSNELYTGRVINGKEEVSDFLTGERIKKDKADWAVTARPDLRIIGPEEFDRVQLLLKGRGGAFKLRGERQSNSYMFSTLIKCRECGWSFRRMTRTYKKTYIRWVCSCHNGRGADSCPNAVSVDEDELMDAIQSYFSQVLNSKNNIIQQVISELSKIYKAKSEGEQRAKALREKLARLHRARIKYMDMYTDDLISREELNSKIGSMREQIACIENDLNLIEYNFNKSEQLEDIIRQTFRLTEDIADIRRMSNTQLKQIIQKIEVDKDGNVDIHLRLFDDLPLEKSVPVCYGRT